jgi:hypothetical protein
VSLDVKSKVQGQDKAVLLNGQPLATTHEPGMHLKREDHINIAKGMDMVVAIGFAVARYDKQAERRRSAAAAGGAAGGGGA